MEESVGRGRKSCEPTMNGITMGFDGEDGIMIEVIGKMRDLRNDCGLANETALYLASVCGCFWYGVCICECLCGSLTFLLPSIFRASVD